MPAVDQLNGRVRGTLVAVVVVFWSLVSRHAGRCCRGRLVAWAPGPVTRKSGCAGQGLCDNLLRSGPVLVR